MDIKSTFIEYDVDILLYDRLCSASTPEEHLELWKVVGIQHRHIFNGFIEQLVGLKLLKSNIYSKTFNSNIGTCYFGYSPLLKALMIDDEYIFPKSITSDYKVLLGYYIAFEGFSICSNKFESFKCLAKRVDWPKVIEYSLHNGIFGDEVTRKAIAQSIPDMFRSNCKAKYFKPAGHRELMILIAYGLFDDYDLLYKVLEGDSSISLSTDTKFFVCDYVRHRDLDVDERYDNLHSTYHLTELPQVTIHGFEQFFIHFDTYASNELKLLARLV